MEDARQHFEGALRTYRQLAQQNPDAYVPYLAMTLDDLAAWINARTGSTKPASIMRKRCDLTVNWHNRIGRISLGHGHRTEQPGTVDGIQTNGRRASALRGTLKIYRQPAQQNPDAHMPTCDDAD